MSRAGAEVLVNDLTVMFGAVRAVDSVTLSIPAGELHGLIGPNGAGKSTLINVISGRTRPNSGSVHLGDAGVLGRSPARLRRLGVSRSFQTTSVFVTLTVRDQLEMVARRLREQSLAEIVGHLELLPFMDRVCGTISYGDQRRVDLALALIGNPRVLLLDEPAAGLTGDETMKMLELVASMAQDRGLTVLLVEHDVPAVFGFADRITVMDRGAVLTTGKPEDVRQDQRVIDAYLGSMA